jgi:hypothetical protein
MMLFGDSERDRPFVCDETSTIESVDVFAVTPAADAYEGKLTLTMNEPTLTPADTVTVRPFIDARPAPDATL